MERAAIVVGLLLRGWIVFRGGQFFWPDESRYQEAREAVATMAAGRWQEAWIALLNRPEHLLFKVVGLLPAAVEHTFGRSDAFAAGFFATFSAASLLLLGRLVRRMGGSDEHAAWTVALAVGTTSLLYYSRHLLPYDQALAFGLLAWLCACGTGARAAAGTGLWAALCFLSYNGYWMLGGGAMVAAVLMRVPRGLGQGVRHALIAATALAAPLLLVMAGGAAIGADVVGAATRFAGTIITADIGQGARTMLEYFWHAERWSGLVLLVLALSAPLLLRRVSRPVGLSLIAVVALAAVVWALDALLHRFVVHGRSVRQIMPFLLIAAGGGCAALWAGRGWPRRGLVALLVVFAAQAAANLGPVLAQWFPQPFREVAQARAQRLSEGGERRNYQVAFASFYFTPATIPRHALPGEVVWQRAHPLQFQPYLYEGFTRTERAGFRERDFAMRLIAMGADERGRGWRGAEPSLARHAGFPGAVRLRLRFPAERTGAYEPLIVTGESGRGNLLYVIYQDSAHVRFGFDHWGIGGVLSEPVRIAWNEPVDVVVSMRSLFPPGADGTSTGRLYVSVGEQVILDQFHAFHPSTAGSVTFGLNLIGGGTAHAEFSGAIEAIEPAEL